MKTGCPTLQTHSLPQQCLYVRQILQNFRKFEHKHHPIDTTMSRYENWTRLNPAHMLFGGFSRNLENQPLHWRDAHEWDRKFYESTLVQTTYAGASTEFLLSINPKSESADCQKVPEAPINCQTLILNTVQVVDAFEVVSHALQQ